MTCGAASKGLYPGGEQPSHSRRSTQVRQGPADLISHCLYQRKKKHYKPLTSSEMPRSNFYMPKFWFRFVGI